MSFYKEVPGRQTTLESTLKFDTKPTEGSTNPVTSDGVKGAIDGAVGDASEALQEQIDDIAEKAGSGYTPKGEADVATLNGLSGQENGWLYTMTDAGTLTDGSLAVVAGDTVAWDATNSVWYKAMDYAPRQYGTNEVHNLPTAITAFRTGDVIAVDGQSGTAKMSKDDLLKETAENARTNVVKHSTVDFMISNENGESVFVIKDGFEETKHKKFEQGTYVDFSIHNGSECLFFLRNGLPFFKGFNFSKNSFVDFGIQGKDGKWVFCIKDGKLITGSEDVTDYYKTCKNYGKSVGVFGGSLSVYPESETAKDLWRKNLAMDVSSYGVGGAGFSSLQGTSIQQQVDGAAKKDVYILWASTNDYTHNREIGNYTDYTYLDNYDTSKLVNQCGGINYCIKKLYEKNTLAEVYFFTGIDFFSDEGGYNPFTQQTNSLGYTYQEYVDAQKKCCELFSIPVLDQNAISGLNIFNYTNFFKSDNLHMNEEGYRKIGMQQVQFLANGLT